ncbi:MAG: hypothetical protein KBE23_04660 [Chloroflexi bacterium]|nr:hypothetical protein [Chloroflexota bacterium]MBP7042009.1 hypothetical protein [Chloroflexota bacterium]
MKTRFATIWVLFFLWLFTGCQSTTSGTVITVVPLPTPTTFLFFTQTEAPTAYETRTNAQLTAVPTVAGIFSERNTPVPTLTKTPFPTYPPLRPNFSSTDTITKTIYDDALNENWTILEDTGAIFDTASEIRVHSGQRSIAFTPEIDFSTLFFTVKPETRVSYPFSEVVGIDFWLNSGDDYLQLDELAVAVVGSNDYYYWVADDKSVAFPQGESFSETRLYFLGLNRSIPPETWVEVYLPMESLVYDPEYQYVTGFYLKNDAGFANTIYIDDINFLMTPNLAETPIPSRTVPAPIGTPSPEGASPDGTSTPAANASAEPAGAACEVTPPPGWVSYRIKTGDTIANLAFAAGASLESVLDANCLSTDSVLSLNREIWLPSLPVAPTPTG